MPARTRIAESVDGLVGQRYVFEPAVEELDVGDAGRGGVGAGEVDHFGGGVDAVGAPGGSDPAGAE